MMSEARYWHVVLAECHGLVWAYRRELEAVWPTPGRGDALRFAVTEAAEALDAELRANPLYARNRAREMDELDELADCALMLLTALGPEPELMRHKQRKHWLGLERMVFGCADALLDHTGNGVADKWLWDLVAMIEDRQGMDLPARLRGRLERIKAKRLGNAAAVKAGEAGEVGG